LNVTWSVLKNSHALFEYHCSNTDNPAANVREGKAQVHLAGNLNAGTRSGVFRRPIYGAAVFGGAGCGQPQAAGNRVYASR